jgi:nitrogen fixation protein FixH
MKLFLYILYSVFICAMGIGIYVAYRDTEGLVETNYYETGTKFFQSKAFEAKLEIVISKPEALKKGNNTIHISVTSQGKPLENAKLHLFVGNLSKAAYDYTKSMQELSPGHYQVNAEIPFKGIWLVRIDLDKQQLTTSRKWFYNIN